MHATNFRYFLNRYQSTFIDKVFCMLIMITVICKQLKYCNYTKKKTIFKKKNNVSTNK